MISNFVSVEALSSPPSRKVIDPFKRGEVVLKNVFDPVKNTRHVYGVRFSYSYGESIGIDNGGCSYLCNYCWVAPQKLTGAGPMIDAMRAKGQKIDFTPEELALRVIRFIEKYRTPNVQITGAETFLTPDWTLEVVERLARYLRCDYPRRIPRKYAPGTVWIDSQGFDLVKYPRALKELARLSKQVRLLISIKAHPDDFEKLTNVDKRYAETAFQALELAWQHRIPAFPQMIDSVFPPHRMEWLFERLSRIHPNAPRVLEFDHMRFFPYHDYQNMNRMKRAGFTFGKGSPDIIRRNVSLKAWQEMLRCHYGADNATPPYPRPLEYFDCDTYPFESVELLKKWVFNTSGLAKPSKPR